MGTDTVKPATKPIKLLLTPEEAASALSIKRTYLYHLLATGQLYSIKVGRARRIPSEALHAFVERLCQKAS
jgi:excisionase family DNA binding protein